MSRSTMPPAAASPLELQGQFLDHLLAPDPRGARELIEQALAAGVPAAALYLEVIAPAMYEVGRLWELARISVAQEHLSTQITQAVIAALALHLQRGPAVGSGRVAVVSATPGELHALGGQMVADFLESQSWTVLNLGADTPAQELAAFVGEHEPAVVALSTALPGHLPSVTRTGQLLRQLARPPCIIVGGRAYGGDEGRARAIGADAFAANPQELLALLDRRFGTPAR